MKNKLTMLIIGVLSLGLTPIASATLFDFTPTALGQTASTAYESVNMTVDGIRVDISAYTIANDGSGTITSLTQVTGTDVNGDSLGVYVSSSENLGVTSSGSDGNSLDGGNPDESYDPDEGLLFVFDQLVSLDLINFDSFGSSDDFNLTVDNTLIVADFGNNSTDPNVSVLTGDSFRFEGITGTRFLIWADGASDAFRVDYLLVTAVPAPGALALLSLGLAGIFITRQKKSIV